MGNNGRILIILTIVLWSSEFCLNKPDSEYQKGHLINGYYEPHRIIKRGYYQGEGYYASNYRRYSEEVYWKCKQKCESNPKDNCVDVCCRATDLDGTLLPVMIIFIFFLILFICVVCNHYCQNKVYTFKNWSNRPANQIQSMKPDNKPTNPSNFYQNQTYLKLVDKHNMHALTNSSPSKQFTIKAQFFCQKMGQSDAFSKQSTFKICWKGKWISSQANVIIDHEENNLKQIRMRGKDMMGEYECNGAIIMKNTGQMLVWFMKFYEDRQASEQLGEFSDLIFESTRYMETWIQGKWYFEGHEGEDEYSGKWTLKPIDIQLQYLTSQSCELSKPLLPSKAAV